MADSGYKTRQRALIEQVLTEQADRHLQVDEVVEQLRQQGSPVGRSTVYRCLERMADDGRVHKYFLADGMGACYQYAGTQECHTHFHLKCTGCGTLLHLECSYLDEISAHLSTDHRFALDCAKTVFYGLCARCTDEKSKQTE